MTSEEPSGPSPRTLRHGGCGKPGKGLGNGEGFPSPPRFGQAWHHQELPAALPRQRLGGNIAAKRRMDESW